MSGTAEVHQNATLTPSKLELLATWLPGQPWYDGSDPSDVERIAAYRFVDPYGEVGIETLLVRTQGVVYQVPLTYRDAPLEGADEFKVGEMDHSVLGHRYIYDATGDPIYVDELMRVIREGDDQAELSNGVVSMTVRGSGVIPLANSTSQMKLSRQVHPEQEQSGRVPTGTLDGTWTLDGTEMTTRLVALY